MSELENNLNKEQRKVYDDVIRKIEHQYRHEKGTSHENGPCSCTEPIDPVRAFVAGELFEFLFKLLTSKHLAYRVCWMW